MIPKSNAEQNGVITERRTTDITKVKSTTTSSNLIDGRN